MVQKNKKVTVKNKKIVQRGHIICINEKRLTEVETKVNDLVNTINGNGRLGMRDVVTRIDENLILMKDDFSGLKTNVSALVKFQISVEAEKEVEKKLEEKINKEEEKRSKKWYNTRWWFYSFIMMLLASLTLLLKILGVY